MTKSTWSMALVCFGHFPWPTGLEHRQQDVWRGCSAERILSVPVSPVFAAAVSSSNAWGRQSNKDIFLNVTPRSSGWWTRWALLVYTDIFHVFPYYTDFSVGAIFDLKVAPASCIECKYFISPQQLVKLSEIWSLETGFWKDASVEEEEKSKIEYSAYDPSDMWPFNWVTGASSVLRLSPKWLKILIIW